jgi:hypothetical protein
MTQTLMEKLKLMIEDAGEERLVSASAIESLIEEYKATEQEPDEYQIKILGERWTHCAKHIYDPNNPNTRALFTHPQLPDETVKVPEGYALVPIEPTEKIIQAYVDNLGGIVGTPEALANPEFIERNKQRQRKAGISHYKVMIDEAMKAERETKAT